MKRQDLETLTIQEMAQAAEDRIVDVLLLLDGILGEAKPKTEDAQLCISFIEDFNAILDRSWERASPYLHEIAGGKP